MDSEPTTPATSPVSSGTPATLPSVPSTWPGGFGAYKYSKQAVMLNIGTLVGLFVTEIVVSIVLGAFLGSVGRVLTQIIGLALGIATIFTLLAGVRGQKLSFEGALRKIEPMLVLKYFVSSILVGLALGVSLLLLIVPFFFVFPRLLLVSYFLLDKNIGPVEAIKASWDSTEGHAGQVWGIVGASLAMALLAVTIIGIPFAIYFLVMYSASSAVLYEFLHKTAPAAPAAETLVPSPSEPAAPVEPANE
jgi:hypothetical protein